MRNARQTVRELERASLSSKEKTPDAAHAPTQVAPRDKAKKIDESLAGNRFFASFDILWGDLVTLLSIAVCAWFLIQMARQLLHE